MKFRELAKLKDRYDAAKALLPRLGKKVVGVEFDLVANHDAVSKEYLAWETFMLTKPDHIRAVLGFIELEAQAAVVEGEAAFKALGIELEETAASEAA